jgi:short-subunit dehydrogenase
MVERVLITGASSGLGAALAQRYARRGARLALLARDGARLDAVARAVDGHAFVGDVADPEVIAAAAAHALQEWGGLDVVVANAGYALGGTFDSLTLADVRRQFETNVFGVLTTITATLPSLRAARGRLAIIGSLAGTVAPPGTIAYAMSKAALRPLADGLRMELARAGVSVTLITPGMVVSDIRRRDRAGHLDPAITGPEPSWMAMPAEVAARRIQRAIDRRSSEAVITLHAKALLLAWRWLPGVVRMFLGRARSGNDRGA